MSRSASSPSPGSRRGSHGQGSVLGALGCTRSCSPCRMPLSALGGLGGSVLARCFFLTATAILLLLLLPAGVGVVQMGLLQVRRSCFSSCGAGGVALLCLRATAWHTAALAAVLAARLMSLSNSCAAGSTCLTGVAGAGRPASEQGPSSPYLLLLLACATACGQVPSQAAIDRETDAGIGYMIT